MTPDQAEADPERDALKAVTVASQTNPILQRRVEVMEQTIVESYIEEGRLLANRETLLRQLTLRFGPLPETVLQRIEAASDLVRLRVALDQVIQMKRLEELNL